ncbi:conserved hypothetical protein [Leishmania mexicana MHOM/GT/2001/U1103]|uniref:Uncharacterized protein n=1 Tax=Leishmania mexicana (strain MHOM/GT/2001/U1103) TaxID=929439 RepID=E9AMU8_LEIMU|nr:conserved hypothetical protein [Leishmania mexicana MHOM/GT/2001/U1103]CBZ24253.1 conserved hypothetical protein [Leishmania mexicana MHOM/GT/2001/U1103]
MANYVPGDPLGVAGLEAGKGAGALLAAVQQWSAEPSHEFGDGMVLMTSDPAATTTPSHASSLSPEQRVALSAGAVTCLSVASLPGTTDTAVAVVGTTVGTVALLLIEGSRAVYKVAECSLTEWSSGAITAQDAIVDVAFSMDPAGRPEFVSVASAGCVVVLDVQLLYRSSGNGSHSADEEVGDTAAKAPAAVVHRAERHQKTEPWSKSALRPKAVEALERSSAQLVRRSCSDVFACSFVEADVVRILAPQRLQAAVAIDVALVVVLSNGALHYVERVVEGGSVRLLAEHHRQRLAKGATFTSHASSARQGEDSAAASDFSTDRASLHLLTDSRAVPHVIYRYRLSPYHLQACQDGGQTASGGGGNYGMAALALPSATESVTHVCDAHLHFSEKDGACHVVLAGTQRVPVGKVGYMPLASRVGSLGHAQQHFGVTGCRTLAWWAVVHNAVLPRQTFDRSAVEQQALQQLQRQQQQQQPHDGHAFSPFHTNAGPPPFTVHVQSNTMALPCGLGACPASALTSPATSSPATAGAGVASGVSAAGPSQGSGFAAALMLSDVFVLASGQELYVGDLRDVPRSAKTLPVPRPLRSFSSVVEGITAGPYMDARAVLVATGSRVVPVPLV